MAVQFRVDNIIDNGDGTVDFQIGPYGFTKEKSWFFDRNSFSSSHLVKNLRLAHKIGVKADIASREFLDSVNGTNKGMDLGDKTYFIRNITLSLEQNGKYEVGFATTRNGPVSQTVEVDRNDIEQDTSESPEDVFDNIKSFLRVGNFTNFTPAAIAAIKARNFWA